MSNTTEDKKSYSLKTVIFAVAAAQFIMPYMLSGVGPLLPAIGYFFHATAVELSLINGVYALSLAMFQLVAGRIGDIVGRRRLFLIGLGLFVCISGMLPFSPTILSFLLLRFIQAMGVACMNTSALSILVSCTPKEQLGRVLGIASIGVYLGVSFGPGLAGITAKFFDWKYLFYGMVPIGIIAWFLMAYTVKDEWYTDAEGPFDWFGSILYGVGIAGLSIGITWITSGMWPIILILVSITFLIFFFKSERTKKSPILDVIFLTHNRIFLLSILVALINYSAVFGIAFYFSLYLQIGYGFSVLKTGMILSLQPVVQLIVSPIAGRLADAFGAIKISILGLITCGIGLFFATMLDNHSKIIEVGYAQILLGLGLGLFSSPNTTAIMSSVDSRHMSQAAGLVGTMRMLGLLLSMVIISLTMHSYFSNNPLTVENINKFLQAMDMNLWFFSILNLAAIILSFYSLKKPQNVLG